MRISISFFILAFPFLGITQTIKPSVFNMGGGYSIGLSVNSEWSIGEMAFIGTYQFGNIQFNAGILQPKTDIVTGIVDFGSVPLGNQISISPNPSYDNVKISFKMQKPGKVIVSILNSASHLYRRMELGEIDVKQAKTIVLDAMPVGVYFFDVVFHPINGLVQHGLFKVIRL